MGLSRSENNADLEKRKTGQKVTQILKIVTTFSHLGSRYLGTVISTRSTFFSWPQLILQIMIINLKVLLLLPSSFLCSVSITGFKQMLSSGCS